VVIGLFVGLVSYHGFSGSGHEDDHFESFKKRMVIFIVCM